MLVHKVVITALSFTLLFALGGVALASDIGDEAGNYEFIFQSDTATSLEMGSMATVSRPGIGTEAGDWRHRPLDSSLLNAAVNHNYDQRNLTRIGTEAGNDVFQFEGREVQNCSGMLC